MHSRPQREANGCPCRRSGVWDSLHERFEVERSSHQEAYRLDGAGADMAAEYVFRLRRAEAGIHHRLADAHSLRQAQESS